jgi:cytochrome c-type biogenesis protein CcmH/NrfF
LWAGPFVLAIVGLALLWRAMKRRRAAAASQAPLSADDRERLRKLIAE